MPGGQVSYANGTHFLPVKDSKPPPGSHGLFAPHFCSHHERDTLDLQAWATDHLSQVFHGIYIAFKNDEYENQILRIRMFWLIPRRVSDGDSTEIHSELVVHASKVFLGLSVLSLDDSLMGGRSTQDVAQKRLRDT